MQPQREESAGDGLHHHAIGQPAQRQRGAVVDRERGEGDVRDRTVEQAAQHHARHQQGQAPPHHRVEPVGDGVPRVERMVEPYGEARNGTQ
jgi:hypothetical protein